MKSKPYEWPENDVERKNASKKFLTDTKSFKKIVVYYWTFVHTNTMCKHLTSGAKLPNFLFKLLSYLRNVFNKYKIINLPIVHTLWFSSMHYHQCKVFAQFFSSLSALCRCNRRLQIFKFPTTPLVNNMPLFRLVSTKILTKLSWQFQLKTNPLSFKDFLLSQI